MHSPSDYLINYSLHLFYPFVKLFLECIHDDACDDDQVADEFPLGEAFVQDDAGQDHDEDVGAGVDDCAVFHVYLSIGVGVDQQYCKEDEVGQDHSPVQVFEDGVLMGLVRALFQQDLG